MFSYEKNQEKVTQKKQQPNNTGIPAQLKEQYEKMSGFSFDNVRVYYNSDKPERLQSLAYTQGNNIFVGPGQEKHLRHELFHVVQQKQGRVRPTTTVGGLAVNDEKHLEEEADDMIRTSVIQRRPRRHNDPAPPAPLPAIPYHGFGLSAHHIIPVSMLNDLFDILPEALQQRILDAAQPATGLPAGTIQDEFREWTSGNLFMGPSTNIRIDPTPVQDTFDSDAEFITDSHLYKKLKEFNDSFEKFDSIERALERKEQIELAEKLYQFYMYAKNWKRSGHQAAEWTEITDMDTMEMVLAARSEKIDNIYFRIHIANTGGIIAAAGGGNYQHTDWSGNVHQLAGFTLNAPHIFIKMVTCQINKKAIEDLLERAPGAICPYAVVPSAYLRERFGI